MTNTPNSTPFYLELLVVSFSPGEDIIAGAIAFLDLGSAIVF